MSHHTRSWPWLAGSLFALGVAACGDDAGSSDEGLDDESTSTTSMPATSSSSTSSPNVDESSSEGDESSSGDPADECPNGFCATPLPAAYYGGIVQLGDDVVLMSEDQLWTVELDGSLTPLGPPLLGFPRSVARDADGVLTVLDDGIFEISQLEGDTWMPVDLLAADGSPIEPSSVFATDSSATYVVAATTFGGGPLYRIEGTQLVSEEVSAETMVGLGDADLWAIDGSYTSRWDGGAWIGGFDVPGPCRFGIAAATDDAMCVGDGSFDDPIHWDGNVWTEVAIPDGGWVRGLATFAGSTTAVSNDGHRPIVSQFDGASWTSVEIDLYPEVPRVDAARGAGALSDGRLVFLAYLILDDTTIDSASLVIEQDG